MPVEAPPAPAAAPAAPAPAPSTSHVAIPDASKGTDSQQPPGSNLNNAFADLDKFASEPTAEAPTIPKSPAAKSGDRQRAAARTKLEPTKPAPPSEEAEDVEPAKAEETPKPADTAKPDKSKKPSDFLREELAKVKAERDEWKTKAEKPPAEDVEKKTLAERLAEREKQVAEYENEIKFADYSKSEEYKKTYEKPFFDAYGSAQNRIKGMKVVGDDGTVRTAEAADFDKLMRVQDEGDAATLAKELFGNAAPSVMYHRQRVIELSDAAKGALEEFRTKGAEREKQTGEQRAVQQKKLGELWEKMNKEADEKFPNWFKPVEGDDEGNALLEKGTQLAIRAFNGTNLSPEERVGLESTVFKRAAGFGRLTHQNAKLSKELAEARAALKAYEESEPGKGEGDGSPKAATPRDDTMEGALERLGQRAGV